MAGRRPTRGWRPSTLRVVFVLLCLGVFLSMILQGRHAAHKHQSSHPGKKRVSGRLGMPDSKSPRHAQNPSSAIEDIHSNTAINDGHRGHDKPNGESDTGDGSKENMVSIAIGSAITSSGFTDLSPGTAAYRLPFLRTLMPSFCNTASPGFAYHFYLSFDHTDRFLSRRDSLHAFNEVFRKVVDKRCSLDSTYALHFVECSYESKPAWSQNDAMMEGYLDERDYYFRLNDDIILKTKGWTEIFIDTLRNNTPPNTGVTGPTHTGGNEEILTQDFVHKTHMDVFGFYYPRLFTDWWADDWITNVYKPNHYSKSPKVEILHTQERGTRYKPHMSREQYLMKQIEQDQRVFNRYMARKHLKPDGTKVISMSLWGHEARYTFGCLRNAQLTPVIFPEWTLRVYVERERTDGMSRFTPVPQRILDKLYSLGADVVQVDPQKILVSPMMWRFLVADDPHVQWFIVRDADSRLIDRDATAVDAWMKEGSAAHCERDHPSHGEYSLSGGLWGGQPKLLKQLITMEWEGLMRGVGTGYGDDMNFLSQVIWPRVQSHILCHDSISCTKWPSSQPFPSTRWGTEHVGQVFDAFGNPREEDIAILLKAGMPAECSDTNLLDVHDRSKFTIWNMDYHISFIRSLKYLLADDDVNFIVNSLSERCHVIEGCADDLRVITSDNAMELTPDLIQEFEDVYRNSSQIRDVTHFVCFYPSSMCELYQRLNKSIIVVAAYRYEQGRATQKRWRQWNSVLANISKSKNNIIAATNKYDQEYIKYFTGYQPMQLQVHCGYTKVKYAPEKTTFALYPISNFTTMKMFDFRLQRELHKRNSSLTFQPVKNVFSKGLTFKDIVKYKGVVYFPDDVTPPVLCELYAMHIPLFVPSIDLLIEMHLSGHILNKLTLNRLRLAHGEDVKGGIRSKKSNGTDPNAEWSAQSLLQWLPLADYYQWPHIVHFSSIGDLLEKIDDLDLQEITRDMQTHNKVLKEKLHQQWLGVLNQTMPHR